MAQHLLAKRRYKRSYWLLAFGLAAIQGLFLWQWQGLSWFGAMAYSMVLWLGGALLLYGFVQTTAYYFPQRFALLFGLASTVVLTALLWVLQWIFFYGLKHTDLQQPELLQWVRAVEMSQLLIAMAVLGGGIGMALLWYRLEEKASQLKRQVELDQYAREAELYKLRQQLQPHFLFNSLNSINALIGTRPKEAREMTQKLADFFRGTLDFGDAKRITFEEEWQQLQRYLAIEIVRFGHRLKVETDIAKATMNSKLPPLICQPLLENAIKYGLYGTLEETTLEIRAWTERKILKIAFSNPYEAEGQPEGLGFGINAVQRRLYLLYGRKDLLRLEKQEGQFRVCLSIPQDHA